MALSYRVAVAGRKKEKEKAGYSYLTQKREISFQVQYSV